ncbi:MAG: tetratricopeptide repeat protein, partial [Gemmataceae bacterium]|nr:tetratricopeptide repeat protein [Gemmataceae bacterium]
KAREFEDARRHAVAAARHLELDEAEQVTRVVEAALAEVRRLFAREGNEPVRRTIARVDALAGKRVPEATFWEAMGLVRDHDLEGALPKLLAVSEETARQVIDPPFYAGIVQFRLGRPQEALKLLSEANRIDSNCPLVTWQIGVALMASGGDSATAMRALQRAMGPRGLPLWGREPHKLWIEGFPEGRSYVRRLAAKNGTDGFPDPLLGNDFGVLVRQGNLALAQAYYKQEKFDDAANLYGKLLESSPPTVMLLRGYGLSLARQGRHDEAYKQLRLALEQEDPKDPFTAGYLALCGAMGKPVNAADKPKNVAWALRLLAAYPLLENAEWAGIVREVHAEARRNHIEIPEADQELLCDALASVQADDAKAAAGYAHLAMTHPGHVKPIYAWLYARAATVHGVTSPVDLDLFARTFQESGKARGFFAQQKWDFCEVEYAYLERTAKKSPGGFPPVLGPDYAPRGEAFLLARSESEEKEGRKDSARASAEVLLKLAPESLKGHDRLACLHYRTGDTERAVDVLAAWGRLAPQDHWPFVRKAVIEQERGKPAERREAIMRAMDLTSGRVRGAVAFLGAELALRDSSRLLSTGKARPFLPDLPEEAAQSLADGKRLLEECLREEPGRADALWRLAAVRTITRDKEGLAGQAPSMDRPDEADPRFHYFGAICHLEAGKPDEAFALVQRAGALQQEARLVMAWAKLRSGDRDAAAALLKPVAADGSAPSVHVARALLGKLAWEKGDYDEAALHWAAVDASARARWGLDEPLRQTVLLAGLSSMEREKYEQAAERFREAGRLGLRDRRLGGLVTLALVKAGQRLLYGNKG